VTLGGLKSNLLLKAESTLNSEQVAQGFTNSKSMLTILNYLIFLYAAKNGFQADLFHDFLRDQPEVVWIVLLAIFEDRTFGFLQSSGTSLPRSL